jgi:short-subunit dehydrogenase
MTGERNRTIIVTGATSGYGLALIGHLKDAGYRPILTGRDSGKVPALADRLGVPGVPLDVSDFAAIADVAARIEGEYGPIWGLVNNAGIWLEGTFIDYTPEQIHGVINTNTMGTIMMTHAILPGMIKRGQGTILNVVSSGALYTRATISVYSASKWAIRGFTGCLEAECAPQGVRVMGFYPGKIATNLYESAGIERDLDIAMTAEQAATMTLAMLDDESMVWSQVGGRSIRDYK